MTDKEFETRILVLLPALHRISYTILYRECDREDAVQECIKNAWQKRNSLRNDALFKQWVLRILVNECRAVLRCAFLLLRR